MAADAPCPFCPPASPPVAENDLAVAFRDGFPVTPLHTLVVPRRHVGTYFDLTHEEASACYALLAEVRDSICAEDPTVTGFNVGANAGAAAGQTVFHSHIHLIPRRHGDVERPQGGVRHVIPGMGDYLGGP